MYQNYQDSIHLNNSNNSSNNNNIVFMQTKMHKNVSSSKLELLKQKYFINNRLKKEKLLFSKTKEEKSISISSDIKDKVNEEENEIIVIDLPIIDLSEEITNKDNTIDTNDLIIGIDIDIDNYVDYDKESTIINLNETTVIFQDKIL
jgi:hypothetical protein